MKKLFTIACLLVMPVTLIAQSKPLDLSVTVLDLNNYQLLAEKGEPDGYAPLNNLSLVPPSYIFPGFQGAPNGTIWSKSSGTFQAVSGLSFASNTISTTQVRVGELSSGVYGVSSIANGSPLVLFGGSSTNTVYIGTGQTLAGSSSGYVTPGWTLSPIGDFNFRGGVIRGGLSMSNSSISNVALLTTPLGLRVDMVENTITSLSNGKDIVFTGTGMGVRVPNINLTNLTNPLTSNSTRLHSLNVNSADQRYVRIGSSNTWTAPQVFAGSVSMQQPLGVASGGTGVTNLTQLRSALGLNIGPGGVQANSQILTSIAASSPSNNSVLVGNGSVYSPRSPSEARQALELRPGTEVQAFSAILQAVANSVSQNTNNNIPGKYIFVGSSNTYTPRSAAAARADLGLQYDVTGGVMAYNSQLHSIALMGAQPSNNIAIANGSVWTSVTPTQLRSIMNLSHLGTNVSQTRDSLGVASATNITEGVFNDARIPANIVRASSLPSWATNTNASAAKQSLGIPDGITTNLVITSPVTLVFSNGVLKEVQ